jgi:ABC-type nitrate/sulfonate/bicarbonate transport system substrate-binding protein
VVIVAGFNRAYYVLVARPQVRSYADLKGKVIGVSALRAGETPLLRALLRARGLSEGDYQMVVAGGTPERVTAIQAGSIDATMLTPPLDLPLVQKGFTRLGASTEVLPDFAFLTLGTNRPWAQANSEALVRVLAALTEATDWLLNPSNRDRAVQILAKRLNVSPDEARQTYEGTVAVDPPLFYRNMAVTETSLQKVLEFMVEDGTIQASEADPRRYLDTSYLDEALRRRGVKR